VENQEIQSGVGVALNYQVQLFKGEATTWSYSGNLPATLTLNSTGVITGTPSEAFSGSITVTASNESGSSSKTLKIIILNVYKLEIDANQRFYAKVGTPFKAFIKYSGVVPQRWENLNSLPAGLKLDALTGEISGTPTISSTITFNIKISHTDYASHTAGVTIDVLSATAALRVVTGQTFNYAAGANFSFTPAVIGTPLTWDAKGLPATSTINKLTGQISGNIITVGIYSITLIVRSGANAGTGTIKLKIT
jgi:hypothetical protein